MIDLIPYTPALADALAPFVVSFWKVHHSAYTLDDAMQTLSDWAGEEYHLFAITLDGEAAGFIRVHNSSPEVCWIDDIFVDDKRRGKGVASAAIALIESNLRAEGVKSFCMEVVPDNLPAMRLYHRLGYDRLSLITMRKDIDGFDTERVETISGLPMRVRRFDKN